MRKDKDTLATTNIMAKTEKIDRWSHLRCEFHMGVGQIASVPHISNTCFDNMMRKDKDTASDKHDGKDKTFAKTEINRQKVTFTL